VKVLYVLSEHAGGLTEERLAAYEADRERIATLASCPVESVPYEAADRLDADVLVLSGSSDPWASHDAAALERHLDRLRAFEGPVLGVCAGMQNLVRALGGTIGPSPTPVHGFAPIEVIDSNCLLLRCCASFDVRKRHDDEVKRLPPQFRLLATSATCRVEAIAARDRPWWGTQFHPEAWDGDHPSGRLVVERFLELAGVVS
jgi:GMP synthase-like glutamine amidotransferase